MVGIPNDYTIGQGTSNFKLKNSIIPYPLTLLVENVDNQLKKKYNSFMSVLKYPTLTVYRREIGDATYYRIGVKNSTNDRW